MLNKRTRAIDQQQRLADASQAPFQPAPYHQQQPGGMPPSAIQQLHKERNAVGQAMVPNGLMPAQDNEIAMAR